MPACDGQLVRCHLIPKLMLKRIGHDPWDRRSYVWACDGPSGSGGHHGMLDYSRRLGLPRSAIPSQTEELALEIEPYLIAQQLGHKDGGKLIVERYGHPDQKRAFRRIRTEYAAAAKARARKRL